MEDEQVWRSSNTPEDLLTLDEIVKLCATSGFNRNGVCIKVAGKPRFWVKYGRSVTKSEGRTQAHVASIVNADPVCVVRVPEVYLIFSRGKWAYIVMDFVQGTTFGQHKLDTGHYGEDNMKAVATAVRRLTDIQMPLGTPPGPISGGRIGHNFFVDDLSTIEYPTVGDLENHINTVFRLLGIGHRVDFLTETALNGLVLCPSDLHDSNFMIDGMGHIWAIDFGRTCFLPPSFVDYSLRLSNVFGRHVARLVDYPKSANFHAMGIASGQLVYFNDNTFGAARSA